MESKQNAHKLGCVCCGTLEAISWRARSATLADVPAQLFRPWIWYCSGVCSGGTQACYRKANSTGACSIEMGTDPRTPYDVLGLENGQGDDVAIKRAYKMKWHPDKNMDNVEEATEKKKSVVAAYECIGTAGARLNYGQALHAPSRLRLREARALGATLLRTLKRSKSYVKKTRPGTKYLNHVNRPESPTQTDTSADMTYVRRCVTGALL